MPLPNSYVQTGRMSDYFDAMVNAEAPSRFTTTFLENLGFKSSNDRAFIGVLKELGFLDGDGKPTQRYFRFLDKSQWRRVVAEGVRESFSDLFAINKEADSMSRDDVKNKLRTLYSGQKTDKVINLIAKTFDELTDVADFSEADYTVENKFEHVPNDQVDDSISANGREQVMPTTRVKVALDSLQYHINIVLPETRDQSVYDAIFRSLREHLG
ncbi:MAG: DUF5343 domain-containing protein [Anaerolineaceae bacterium]|nr:DUF5343 domain-containing protein [Anaerolineaceae bacterium]